MPADLSERLGELVLFDLAGMLSPAVRVIREQLERGHLEFAARCLQSWEDVLGEFLFLAVQGVREAQGLAGYRAAVARFSRRQEFRRKGLARLSDGIAQGVEHVVSRWRWIGRGYAADVEAFAAERRAITTTTVAVMSTRAMVVDDLFRGRVALRANLEKRRQYLRVDAGDTGGRAEHDVARIVDLVTTAQGIADARRALAGERDSWRERAQAAVEDAALLARISRLPSLVEQIRQYGALVAEAARVDAKRRVDVACANVVGQLRSLRKSCDGGSTILSLGMGDDGKLRAAEHGEHGAA